MVVSEPVKDRRPEAVITNRARENVAAALLQATRGDCTQIAYDKIQLFQSEVAGTPVVSVGFSLSSKAFSSCAEAKAFAATVKSAIFNHSDALQVASLGTEESESVQVDLIKNNEYRFRFSFKGTTQDLADMAVEKSAVAGLPRTSRNR